MRFTKLFQSVRILNRKLNYGKIVTRTCSAQAGGGQKTGCVVCCYEQNKQLELSPSAAEIDQMCGGKISQQLNTYACELSLGKAFAITDILEYSTVAITSIGPKNAGYDALESLDEARENIRWGVGAGVMLLKEHGCVSVEVDPCTEPDAAAEAAELAAWRFEPFKSPEHCKPPCCVRPLGGASSPLWLEGAVRGRAQNWARCLTDMPANKMTPVDLAQAALDTLCPLGVTVEAHDREWIEAQGMQAFLAVAKGSCDTPMFLECEYKGAGPNSPPVLLAAKGVTFDSGGLCLKECQSMTDNRGSMAGAAVVLAAFDVIARLKLPINVTGVIPICENMVSGQCMKVGDVVQALNGMSIQIENTDMEGRLMMADALVYGQSIYKPSLVIDVATFTRGVLMATGGGAFGCFSNSEPAWRAARRAGAASGDRPWRFPLWRYFHDQLCNDPSVDLRNQGCGHATPCLGAAFLKNFICSDWLHMDITGVGKVAYSSAPPYLDTCRMTGRPTRTLAVLLQHIAAASYGPAGQPTAPPCSQMSQCTPPCTPPSSHPVNPPCTPPSPHPVTPPCRPPSPHPVTPPCRPPSPHPVTPPCRPPSPHPVTPPCKPPSPHPVTPPCRPPSPHPVTPPCRPPSPHPVTPPCRPPSPHPVTPPCRPPSPHPVTPPCRPPSPHPVTPPCSPPSPHPVTPPCRPPSPHPVTPPCRPPSPHPITPPCRPPSPHPIIPPCTPPPQYPGTQPCAPPPQYPGTQPCAPPPQYPGTQPCAPPPQYPGTQPCAPPSQYPGTSPCTAP